MLIFFVKDMCPSVKALLERIRGVYDNALCKSTFYLFTWLKTLAAVVGMATRLV